MIPLFFKSGPPTRIVICLFVHPVLLEAGEAVGRGTKGDAVARRLRTGEIKNFEEAAEQFKLVIRMDPGSREAEQAANLILDSFVVNDDLVNLILHVQLLEKN